MGNEQRFIGRVDDYTRGRPSYPSDILDILARDVGLKPGQVVADLGSGTGIMSRLLLDYGCNVIGVEPGQEMCEAARAALGTHPQWKSVQAPAEATTLPDHSVDGAIAAQAFHWFDPERTRTELLRILRPGGWVALVWNRRRISGTPLLEEYETLLVQYGGDLYTGIAKRWAQPISIATLFGPSHYKTFRSKMEQVLDEQEFLARAFSSSYVPGPADPRHEAVRRDLISLFSRHQRDGVVVITYDTDIFCGLLR